MGQITEITQAVSKLINENLLKLNTSTFNAVFPSKIWNSFSEEEKNNFCFNLIDYCKMKNAYEGIDNPEKSELKIMLKEDNHQIKNVVVFENGIINVIDITKTEKKK